MSKTPSVQDHERVILLIRKIAREEAWHALEEHLIDYVHNEKQAEEAEFQCKE